MTRAVEMPWMDLGAYADWRVEVTEAGFWCAVQGCEFGDCAHGARTWLCSRADFAPPPTALREGEAVSLLRGHLPSRRPGLAPSGSRPSSAATGRSRTACNRSATWTSTRTDPRYVPPAAPRPGPCANLVITSLRLAGAPSIAAALHYPPEGPAAPADDHELLNGSAGALPRHHTGCRGRVSAIPGYESGSCYPPRFTVTLLLGPDSGLVWTLLSSGFPVEIPALAVITGLLPSVRPPYAGRQG